MTHHSPTSPLKQGDGPRPRGQNTIPHLDGAGREILRLAAMAPSGHNSQPWEVRIEGPGAWVVAADPARRLPAVDGENQELFLSLGAFAENLDLAAKAMGFRARIQTLARDFFDRDVLRVRLEKDRPENDDLSRIKARRTIRMGQESREIRKTDVDALAKAAGGGLFYFPRNNPHAQCIREAAAESFRLQAYRDAAQKELVSWLRLSNASAKRHMDGLSTRGMEISGLAGWFVARFVKPEAFLKSSFREKSVGQTAKLAQEGGGWMVLTSRGRDPAALIETGRRFERVALAAVDRKVAIHPMTQVLEEENGKTKLALYHPEGLSPRLVLRVGYVNAYPPRASLRRPVDWIVKSP